MMIEHLLEQALTGLIGERMLAHGDVFFEALRRGELMPPDEIEALEAEWREGVRARREGAEGAERALRDVIQRVRAEIGRAETG